MTRMYVNAKIRLQKVLEQRELGQGTLEYLGVIVVAALLVAALIGVFKGFDLTSKVQTQLDKITNA